MRGPNKNKLGDPPSEQLQRRVVILIEEFGTVRAAALLEISRESIARIAGGLGVRRGTLLIAEQEIAKAMTVQNEKLAERHPAK